MVIVLVVLGALVGMLLGLIALSGMAQISVAGLTTPHPERPARERRQHEHPDFSKREQRYPPVPPPLAPMTETPKVLDRAPERVVSPLKTTFETPGIPSVAAVAPIVALAPSARAPAHIAPSAPPPTFTAYQPPAVPPPLPTRRVEDRQPVVPHVFADSRAAPPPPAAEAPKAAVVIDAVAAIAKDAELQSLLKQGHFIPALNRYRDQHGVGLEEAKRAIDAWRSRSAKRDRAVNVVTETAKEVVTDPHIVAALRKGKIIEAIKLYREKNGVSLQEAKAAIDGWRRELGLQKKG